MRRKIDCLHICANVMWQNGDCMNITTTYKYRFTALYIGSPCSSHSELSQSPPGWQWHPSILALLQPACLFDHKDVQQTETICTSSNIQTCLRNITAIDNWLLSFCRPASKHTNDWGMFIPWSARGSAFFSAAVAMIRFLCVSTCTFGAPLSPSAEHNPHIIWHSKPCWQMIQWLQSPTNMPTVV